MEIFQKSNEIVAVQPKILSDRHKTKFEHAGAAGGYIDKYGYPFCRGRIMDKIEPDEGQFDLQSDIFWASGACFSSTISLRVKGFPMAILQNGWE